MAHPQAEGWCTRQAALADGVGWRTLNGPDYRRLFRGVYATSECDELGKVAALAGVAGANNPRALASHYTAASLWGGVVPSTVDIHVTVPAGMTTRRPRGLVVHSAERTAARRYGVPVTSVAGTFIDMARYLGLLDLVVLGDSLMQSTGISAAALMGAARRSSGRNVRLARRAAGLVRPGVDSPMETRSRLLIVLAGLPEPCVNYVFRDEGGAIRRRLDMAYVKHRLAIEYDGRQHANSTAQWHEDVVRREEFDGQGWRLLVLHGRDIYRTPQHTLDRIVQVMRQRGMRIPRLSEAWREHFPGP